MGCGLRLVLRFTSETVQATKSMRRHCRNFFYSPLAQSHSLWYNKSSRGQVNQCLSFPCILPVARGIKFSKASN